MKISIGMRLREGPWGGGNQFGNSLAAFLRAHNHHVVFDLRDPQLDLILLTDPRPELSITAFTDREIRHYRDTINPKAIVVHRINECDERKGTHELNQRLLQANSCADHTVFVSAWLRDLFLAQKLPCRSTSVIRNGSDRQIFNSNGYQSWDGKGPLKLITHHWGYHRFKGFDIYERVDQLLGKQPFGERFSFTYVGNLPVGFLFKNARYLPPCHGRELADLLRQAHVYLTASRNEPGGHHQNEGACCGLPLLYLNSGSMPEYCDGFGIGYTAETFESALESMTRLYSTFQPHMSLYPHTAERMCGQYHDLFLNLVEHKAHSTPC